jgi:hypothetical protein
VNWYRLPSRPHPSASFGPSWQPCESHGSCVRKQAKQIKAASTCSTSSSRQAATRCFPSCRLKSTEPPGVGSDSASDFRVPRSDHLYSPRIPSHRKRRPTSATLSHAPCLHGACFIVGFGRGIMPCGSFYFLRPRFRSAPSGFWWPAEINKDAFY